MQLFPLSSPLGCSPDWHISMNGFVSHWEHAKYGHPRGSLKLKCCFSRQFVLWLCWVLAEVCTLQLTGGGDIGYIEMDDFWSEMPAQAGSMQVSHFLQKHPVKAWFKEGPLEINAWVKRKPPHPMAMLLLSAQPGARAAHLPAWSQTHSGAETSEGSMQENHLVEFTIIISWKALWKAKRFGKQKRFPSRVWKL